MNGFEQGGGTRARLPILGVVAAWPGEARCLGLRRPTRGQIREVASGLLVVLSGSGAAAAEQASRRLLEGGAERLLSWGVGGGLQPDWRPGELLVSDLLVHDERRWPLDGDWVRALCACLRRRGLSARVGALWHASSLMSNPDVKRRAGRSSGAALADMESLGVVRAAAAAGRPAAILRAVADPLELALPDCVPGAMDENTDWHWGRFGRGMLARPLAWPAQWHGLAVLAGCYWRALRGLRRAAPCLRP